MDTCKCLCHLHLGELLTRGYAYSRCVINTLHSVNERGQCETEQCVSKELVISTGRHGLLLWRYCR